MVIDSLTLEQYHEICDWMLSRPRTMTISTDVTLNLGTVFVGSAEDQLDDWVQIVSFPAATFNEMVGLEQKKRS